MWVLLSREKKRCVPAALLPVEVQELDHLEVAIFRGIVHGAIRATPAPDLVQPLHHFQVAVESRVVHGADAATLLPVLVQPLDDIKVSVGCRSVHGFAGTALPNTTNKVAKKKRFVMVFTKRAQGFTGVRETPNGTPNDSTYHWPFRGHFYNITETLSVKMP